MTTSGVLTEYSLGTPNAQPWDITTLPNGDMWFTEENADQVGVITPQGFVTEYVAGSLPTFITTGPDGNVWFTEELGNDIVRLDPADPST
jgi:virginiamycin B lyase